MTKKCEKYLRTMRKRVVKEVEKHQGIDQKVLMDKTQYPLPYDDLDVPWGEKSPRQHAAERSRLESMWLLLDGLIADGTLVCTKSEGVWFTKAYWEKHHPAADAALLREATSIEQQQSRKDKTLRLLAQVRAIAKEMLDEDIHRAEVTVNGNFFESYLFTLEASAAMILERVHSIRRLEWEL